MYAIPCTILVREHMERLREEASRDRLAAHVAARAAHRPGVWATMRSALAARIGRQDAADDAA